MLDLGFSAVGFSELHRADGESGAVGDKAGAMSCSTVMRQVGAKMRGSGDGRDEGEAQGT